MRMPHLVLPVEINPLNPIVFHYAALLEKTFVSFWQRHSLLAHPLQIPSRGYTLRSPRSQLADQYDINLPGRYKPSLPGNVPLRPTRRNLY